MPQSPGKTARLAVRMGECRGRLAHATFNVNGGLIESCEQDSQPNCAVRGPRRPNESATETFKASLVA